MKTWKTWWCDLPIVGSKDELEFLLALIQHAVSIFLIYCTIWGIAVYLLLL